MDASVKAWSAGLKPSADLTALERRFNLRKRARDEGAKNIPGPNAIDLSDTEREIVAVVAAERAKVDSERSDARAESEQRLRALAPTPQDFTGPTLEARLALKQLAGRLAHDWSRAVNDERRTSTELEAFKGAHHLRRPAFYPRSALLQVGLLLCAALFEAMFSAALFAEDDARGLLGGAITAVGLSGANVTLGFLAGFLGLRYLQHVRWPVKSAGFIAFVLLSFLALMLNLFAADWRDRLAAQSGAPLIDTSSDPNFHLWSLLQLQSPQAIILLMLGAGVWVFAVLKGYSGFDDPYPDYGKMERAAKRASEALSEFRGEARIDLEEPLDAARAAISARLEKMRAEFEAMNRAFDAAALKMEKLDARARVLDEACEAAVQIYRQENAYARATPPPAYFSAAPPAAGPALDALSGCAAMIDNARALLTEAQRASAQALSELNDELDAVQRRLDAAEAT